MLRLLRIALLRTTLAALLVAIGSHAATADDNPLLGRWIMKNQGGALVTEFTPTTMSFTPYGPGNKPTAAPKVAQVTAYKKLTESYEIDLASGGVFIAAFEDPNTLHLYVPGRPDTGRYVRMQE